MLKIEKQIAQLKKKYNLLSKKAEPYWFDDISEIINHSTIYKEQYEYPKLKRWIKFFDIHIAALMSFETVLTKQLRKKSKKHLFKKSLASFSIIVSVIADLMAIRCLTICGYETAARSQARIVREKIDVLILCSLDGHFAERFFEHKSVDEAQQFWRKEIGYGKVRKSINESFMRLFKTTSGLDDWWKDWREEEAMIQSTCVHPSMITGHILASGAGTKKNQWPAMLGKQNIGSARTLKQCMIATWEFTTICHAAFFVDRRELFNGKKGKECESHIKNVRSFISAAFRLMHEHEKSGYL